jgi:hypothetical protein
MSMIPNLALLAGVSFLTLAVAEGLLRLAPGLLTEEAAVHMHWREMGFARDDDGETLVVDDADLGFRYLPHRTGHLQRGDFAFSFTTDEHGFRNASPWPEKADIVVVGDSMGFSFGVGDEAAWTSLVQEALPETTLAQPFRDRHRAAAISRGAATPWFCARARTRAVLALSRQRSH